jgi:transcriptional regulator with XRE-family HTH domain
MADGGRMNFRQKLGLKLKKLREQQGLSLRQTAALTGINKGSISNLEKGKENCLFTTLLKLSNFYEISLDILCGHHAFSQQISTFIKKVEKLPSGKTEHTEYIRGLYKALEIIESGAE